jgi:D-arabinose 5-phosphate isomerase GutQ
MPRSSLTAEELSSITKTLNAAYGLVQPEPTSAALPVEEVSPVGRARAAGKDQAVTRLGARVHSIAFAVYHTLMNNQPQVKEASKLIASWMKGHKPVRILGAGRALLAGGMPGNRLAHAGAQVSYMGGIVPLPNSVLGGGIIACSASGKTRPVLQAMAIAKKNNKRIKTIGIADYKATRFRSRCDVFIGLRYPKQVMPNPLSALADTEEYMIAEILDGLVVLAGESIGFDSEAWRRGHEDIGPTGPYAPRGPARTTKKQAGRKSRLPRRRVLTRGRRLRVPPPGNPSPH